MSINGIGSDWTRSNAAPGWWEDATGSETAFPTIGTQDAPSLGEAERNEQVMTPEGPKASEESEALLETEDPKQQDADPPRLRRVVYVFQRVLKELQALPVFSELVDAAIPEAVREDTDRGPAAGHEPVRRESPVASGDVHLRRNTSIFDRRV